MSIRGETRWFIASLDLHADRRKLVAGIRKITKQKRAEEALSESRERYQTSVESTIDIVDILDESGVVAAIAHLVYDSAVACGPKTIFRSRVTFSRLDPVAENVVYRVVQEGLSNARKHSQSDQVVVSLVQRRDHLRLEVRDWGVGFDPRTVRENRFGLAGIRERARLLGGKSKIRSKPGEGTAVVVELPMGKTRKEKS